MGQDRDKARADETRIAGVIAHPPVIYAAGMATGLVLDWIVPIDVMGAAPGGWRPVAGLVLVGLGLAIVGWAGALFHRAGTNVPTHRPVEALVVSGPYRYSRNPIYVALTLAYLGVALWASSVWMLAVLPVVIAVMRYGVIGREEVLLERLFGDDYRAYRERVRRWL